MKQRILKTLLFMIVFACLSSLLFVSASAAEVTVGDFVFDVNNSVATLKEYKGTASSVTIPSKVGNATVTAIGNEAFWANSTMKSVTIPSTVRVIGTAAFNECTGLTKVNIPNGVTTLGDAIFWYCTNLKQIFIPKTVTFIGENVFTGCHEELTVYVVKSSYSESRMSAYPSVNMAYRYITGLYLKPASVKLTPGATQTLACTYEPVNVYYSKVTYTSSNTKVATVDANGKVTAVGVGSAVIICKTADGGNITAKTTVTVVPSKVDDFALKDVTPTGYTLTWNAPQGATKYRIYRYNATTKKYDTIKYTTVPYLTVTDLPIGSYQYYRVLAYTTVDKTNYIADISSTYKAYVARPAAVSQITAKPANNFINLSWNKADYATGYRVYSYNRDTGAYTFIGATTKTTLKVTDLDPNTTYTFMVRAYLKQGSSVVYAAYSPLFDCVTRPDYVSGLAVKENSVYTNRLTLTWDELPGVDGYKLYIYNDSTGSYELYLTLMGSDYTEYTVTELTAGTEYRFKIRSYTQQPAGELLGYLHSSPLVASTNNRPADTQEAFNGFVDAYNESKTSSASFALVSICKVSGFEGEDSAEYEAVLSSIAQSSTTYSYIVNGTDRKTGLPVSDIVSPAGALITLTYGAVKDADFYDDGCGYRIEFTLGSENDGAQNALLTDIIDWQTVADENDGFILNSCTYDGTTVTAKVNNGYIDDITVTIPVTVEFELNGETYCFSQTITRTYLFIR